MRTPAFVAFLLLGGGVAAAAPAERTERLESAQDVRRLCEALRPDAEVRFRGDEVARGKARAEHEARRREILASVFTMDLPPATWGFREYEFDAQRLEVDTTRTFRLGEGVDLSSVPADADDLAFAVQPQVADQLVKERAKGKLGFRMTFRLAQHDLSGGDPCVRMSGGRIVKLRIDPMGAALMGLDGRVRYVAGAGAPREGTDVQRPLVRLGRPTIQGNGRNADQVLEAAAALEPVLLSCYEAGLQGNKGLRGSLVLGLNVNGEGRIDRVRTEIDALGDETVSSCALAKLRGATGFPRKSAAVSLPIFFVASSEAPRLEAKNEPLR